MSNDRRAPPLPLGALRVFEAAARHGSFKGAAAELSVTPGAVSQQIKLLEQQLRVRLFERLHRALRLTRAGTELAAATSTAFDILNAAVAQLVSGGLGPHPSTLTITCAPSFASRWLAKRLAQFEAQNPGIDLRLLSENALADIAHDPGHDVALRYGVGPYDPAVHAEPLWNDGEIVAVCAPFLVGEGLEERLAANPNLRLRVALPPTPAGVDRPDWMTWLRAAGLASGREAVIGGPMFSNTQLALDAAASGRGVVLTPMRLVQEDLGNGVLALASDVRIPDPYRYWLLYRRERGDEARIRAFVRWIRTAVTA